MNLKQILLAGLLGGITVYVWGALSWTMLPWNMDALRPLPNEAAVMAALRDSMPGTGTYIFPAMVDDDAYDSMTEQQQQAWLAEYAKKPHGLLVYHGRIGDPMSPGPFIGGLVLYLIASTIAAFLLSRAVETTRSYGGRVAFVAMLGLFAVLVSHLAQLNWSFQTLGYTMSHVVDLMVGWVLAGCVIAWRVKPEGVRAA